MPKYRSGLEGKVAKLLGEDWEYEAEKIPYFVALVYTPDFSRDSTYLEVKGFFKPGDPLKYRSIHKTMKEDGKNLVFVFQNPDKPIRRSAKLTLGKWCEKHNIDYCSVTELKGYLNEHPTS